MLIDVMVLVLALGVLTLGAELLVRGAVSIARRLGVSALFIGLTIVGFGTSTPELAASVGAALRGQSGIAVGNVIGSNIFNVLIILGLTAMLAPVPVAWERIRGETAWCIAVGAVPFAALLSEGVVTRWLGLAMIAGLAVFLWRGIAAGRRQPEIELEVSRELDRELAIRADRPRAWLAAFSVIGGLALLVLGSNVLVERATSIAGALGVSDLVVGLTIVAAGTSMPELVTSIVAAVRRQTDISVGNILGSNVFNMLGILSATACVTPQTVPAQVFYYDAPVMLGASLLLVPLMRTGGRISRSEGVLMLALGAAYLAGLVVLTTRAGG